MFARFRRHLPLHWAIANDHEVLKTIRVFGEGLDRPKQEIEQACNLASGPADVVVILERPHQNQKYNIPFEQFVADCETLKVVDDLLRFATKGARSIHTVTVLDAFTFKPLESQHRPSDDECHKLLEEILRMKKPQVVLCCWKGERDCANSYVSHFRSRGVDVQPLRSKVSIDGQLAIAIQSFHPAKALRWEKYVAEYRILIHHFISAFAELGEPIKMPICLESVRKRCVDIARNPARYVSRQVVETSLTSQLGA